jgi:hypothetical protein
MPNTYTLISSNVLASSAASVTFSSIPATYTDLVIRLSARTDVASVADGIKIECNSDTATNYSVRNLTADGATTSNFGFTNQVTANFTRSLNGNSVTANTFGSSEIYLPNYTSGGSVPISSFGTGENNATTAYMGIGAGLYRGSAAISTITITNSNNANFVSGSSFYLYGIKNS